MGMILTLHWPESRFLPSYSLCMVTDDARWDLAILFIIQCRRMLGPSTYPLSKILSCCKCQQGHWQLVTPAQQWLINGLISKKNNGQLGSSHIRIGARVSQSLCMVTLQSSGGLLLHQPTHMYRHRKLSCKCSLHMEWDYSSWWYQGLWFLPCSLVQSCNTSCFSPLALLPSNLRH